MKVFDMHCDTLSALMYDRKNNIQSGLRQNNHHLDLMKMKKGDYMLQCFAVYINKAYSGNVLLDGLKLVDIFYEELEKNKDIISQVTSYSEIEDNMRCGKMSAMLTGEEGDICAGSLAMLRNYYRLGLRMMTLTWNHENELAYPNHVVYNEDGTFLKPNFFIRPAMHAFIDTEIIAKAPAQYMWAGIGDTYAKYYEATISSRGEQLEHFTSLGVALSVMCRNPLLEYGAKALEDHKKGLCTYDVEQVVLAIVVTTGIASIFLTKDFTPDYNSGLAHAIFYALTSYPVIEEKHLHGEVVGFGVLFALLVDQQYEEFEKIYCLNKKLQLPTSLEQIEITEEQWEESMDRIPEMSDIRHYPYKVTKEMLALAMKQLKEREADT